ncbi:IS3 family transposase [Psychrobacter sp. SWN149]|uniref:IS3 family transposase n=1 Tax=Psychrobacter sp. SWN149 TaxID=2792057 RepID=UPI0018CCF32E|nr:IS3 family transposase [Psychrobacter sp. SWN149]MBH0006115.1 IS3 family transposase [Psychrobacter sp. SWN149]
MLVAFARFPAPLTYYRAKDLSDNSNKRSLRQQHDESYLSEIRHIWQDSKYRYGARKVWQQRKADGIHVARCTVERLMTQYEL